MANAFSDQLFKAGLVTKKQIKKVNQAKYQKIKKHRKTNTPLVDENKLRLQKQQAEKIVRDKKLNERKNLLAKQTAITAQIKQLIQLNRQKKSQNKNSQDDVAYNFVDTSHEKQPIATIYISKKIQTELGDGLLAIVKLDESYELVPKIIAEKINIRDEKSVILLNENQQTLDEDDPYADYEIPDDLMW